MKQLTVLATALAQLTLVGVGVAPQLSAHLRGETYLLAVAPVDPVDPFRGAYVSLDYPGLRRDRAPSVDAADDGRRGDVYATLRRHGDVWEADQWTRERPDEAPYLACEDRSWEVRCGIESFFLPQEDAAAMEQALTDGAIAEVRIDDRGNAAVVDVREEP
jgi:uncharacterized membrane-anchored protein